MSCFACVFAVVKGRAAIAVLVAMAGGGALADLTPADLEFRLVHERRFELDGTIPLGKDAFWPGAQYVARVTALPAAVKFVTTDGEEKFRYEVKAGDARLPAVPFDLAVLVTGRVKPAVFTRKDGKVGLLDLVTLPEGFDPRETKYAKTLRFRGEGGAEAAEVALTAGIGQADIRFVTEGRENRPYVEGGRLFFTFSVRGYGSFLGVMSVDPEKPSDLRLEGTIFFDYDDARLRNDLAADLFHDAESGEWRAYVCNFSTGGESGTKGRAPGGVNVARCRDSPLHGVSVMKAKPLGLPGMNEDPDGIWDAASGRWRLLLSEFCPDGVIRMSMWESERWDGPFARKTEPVAFDSTGTTILPFRGRRYCLSGSVDKACYVCSYPELKTIGKLKFDVPPWPTEKTGWPHGRVWPAVAELPDGRCLMVTMDRTNYPGMPQPNWTYGKLMLYVSNSVCQRE